VDPSTLFDSVVGGALATLLGTALLAIAAWLAGPLRWFVRNRKIRTLISHGRRFKLTFNPATQASKVITFQPDGRIGGGNDNEHSWRVRRGALEILASDGRVYSRFRHDQNVGQLRHTNDPDCRSIHGQYIQPLLVKVNRQVA
jgi:hypothetical protein